MRGRIQVSAPFMFDNPYLTPVKDARKPLIFIVIITPFGRTLSDVAAVESFPLKYVHLLYVGKPLLTA
jgi:hypothetical protein